MTPNQRPISTPIFGVGDVAVSLSFYESLGFEVVPYDELYSIVVAEGRELVHL